MFAAIERNKRITVILIFIFIAIVVGVAGYIGYLLEALWIPLVVLGFVLIYTVFQYFMATREVLSLVQGTYITYSQNPMLWNLVENLSIREGIPMPKVFTIPDSAPNAMAIGTSPKNASIGVTSGLLQIMDKSELEAVLAHEVGHIKNYDTRVKTIIFGLVGAVAAIAILGWAMVIAGLQASSNSRGKNDKTAALGTILALLGLAIGVIGSLIAHAIGPILRAGVSKQREYLADASAVETTRFPDALISALSKLQYYETPMKVRSGSTAQLFFLNPLKGKLAQALVGTHPPLEKRIERLQQISRSL